MERGCELSLSLKSGVGTDGVGRYLPRGKDPREVGYVWSAITHEALIVSWEGSDGSYLVDVGFGGGGCPFPYVPSRPSQSAFNPVIS